MKAGYFSILLALLVSISCTRTYDVVVVGGGTGGTAAGICSARSGASVMIAVEEPWLGGMLTSAGVGAIDGNYRMRGGIFAEFSDSVAIRYGGYDSLKTGWVSNIMFEPSVGAEILDNMAAAEPCLDVSKGICLENISRAGEYWKLRFIDAGSGRECTVRAKVVIDGTETGDVMKMAGVSCHAGMDSRYVTRESIAPEESNGIVQDMTWVAVLKDYGPDADVTIARPEGYNPDLYRDCCKNPGNTDGVQPLWTVREMLDYGKLPSGEYMLNWPIEGNDFYCNVLDMDRESRHEAYMAAKNMTLGFIYYIQTELGLKNIGISDSEFPTADGLALMPYHREAGRIDGEVLFTVDYAARPFGQAYPLYRTGIAVGDYAVDHHHDRYDGTEELPDLHFYPIPSFNVPMGALIPAGEDNILSADKSMSVSNIMNGATRLQPVIMQSGQAAGILAALAALTGRDVKEVGVREVQEVLLEGGGYIMPYADLKPGDAGFESIQRIGATGILKGEGRNEGWTNLTVFHIDSPVCWAELAEGLSSDYPHASKFASEMVGNVAFKDLEKLFRKMSPDRDFDIDTLCDSLNIDIHGSSDEVSRLEFSMLLDAAVDPFGSMPVDIYGRTRTALVNPLTGSGGHGHVFVGANVPHGMVAVGPNNVSEGWDWCSGYHDSDRTIAGFAQNHLSGTGIADLGEIVLMPFAGGEAHMEKGTGNGDGYAEKYDKQDETVMPGYYSVRLKESGILAEMTASEHVALHRYTWASAEEGNGIVLDLKSAPKSIMGRQGHLSSGIRKISDKVFAGYRVSDEWARGLAVWFAVEFSSEPDADLMPDGALGGVFCFHDRQVEARVALSYESESKAIANLREVQGKSFDAVCAEADSRWTSELSSIDFKGISPQTDSIFYTALYHASFAPQLYSDFGEQDEYTIFSLWDIYRAAWQLYTLIDPRAAGYAESLIDISQRTGRLPVWHLGGVETDCMVGVHSVPVLADAALKGLVDIDEAWEQVQKYPVQPADMVPGLEYIDSLGWLPADKVNWSVSRALEYCIDDAAAGRLAMAAGDTAAASYHAERASLYRNYFKDGYMRGRLSDGSWRTPFDPSFSLHEEADYIEGNAWQYTWLVPHDVEGLIGLFGGRKNFLDHLDALFAADSELNEGASADITGMIGQYAHGNEPSHHVAYLYALAGEPWKTAELIRQICAEFYSTAPDGLIGNEDCGQMSAWYIFSALGFYPVDPAGGYYVFGSPLCEEAVIRTASGNDFRIVATGNDEHNKYIGSVYLNGKPYDEPGISHETIMKGGVLEFRMTSEPHNVNNR